MTILAVEFGEDSHDLTDGRSHRVVGVVSMDLTGVGREELSSALSDESERRLLHSELAIEAVEASHDYPVGHACSDRV